MPAKIFEITLDSFSFPENLDNNHANFRFLVDLRFIDAEGEPRVVHAVLPSVAKFWECDKDKSSKPNYVRADPNGEDENSPSKFDMVKVGEWDKTIFWVRGQNLKTIRFRVYDVNRKNWWDKFADVLKAIPKALEGFLGPVMGVAEEASSTLIEKTFPDAKLLFQGVQDIENRNSIEVSGTGVKGEYTIKAKHLK